MPSSTPQGNQFTARRRSVRCLRYLRVAVGLAAVASILAVAQQAPKAAGDRQNASLEAISTPDKHAPMNAQQQEPPKAPEDQVHAGNSGVISQDSAQLLQLATDLKNEVDKTSKDTLSVGVIRKAQMIEKLAKGVKEKIKSSGGAS